MGAANPSGAANWGGFILPIAFFSNILYFCY